MNNKLILVLAVLVVLVLSAITLLVIYSNADSSVIFNKASVTKTGNIEAVEYEGDSTSYEYSSQCGYKYQNTYANNACNQQNYDYPSFKYPELGQTRLEPYNTPRPVCPLCREGLEQVKGDGYADNLVQIKTIC